MSTLIFEGEWNVKKFNLFHVSVVKKGNLLSSIRRRLIIKEIYCCVNKNNNLHMWYRKYAQCLTFRIKIFYTAHLKGIFRGN